MNKRGIELVWSTVVVIIISLAVLLFLILFFTSSSESFFGQVRGYFTYSNVDAVVKVCNIYVDSGSNYAFCCEKHEVKYFDDGVESEGMFSCGELLDENFAENKIDSMNCEGVNC